MIFKYFIDNDSARKCEKGKRIKVRKYFCLKGLESMA
jgi:hypothetical protein